MVVTTTVQPTSVRNRIHFCSDGSEVESENDCSFGHVIGPVVNTPVAVALVVLIQLVC